MGYKDYENTVLTSEKEGESSGSVTVEKRSRNKPPQAYWRQSASVKFMLEYLQNSLLLLLLLFYFLKDLLSK